MSVACDFELCEEKAVYKPENGRWFCDSHSSFEESGEEKRVMRQDKKGKFRYLCEHKDENGKQCETRSNYNHIGNTKGLYCLEHKKEGMIDVVNNICVYEDKKGRCWIRPNYNDIGKTGGLYCFKHKMDGMVDVVNKTCVYEDEKGGCGIQPRYNIKNESRGLYCLEHKKEGMIDVLSKTCVYEDEKGRCGIRPNYNDIGKTGGLYCFKHKKERMIDVKHKIYKNCVMFASRPTKYNGYCVSCFVRLYPNDKVSRGYKFREQHVVYFIKKKYLSETMLFDKSVNGGCSKKRPDIMFERFTHSVIIEVDEEQHNGYSCENKRIMELFQDLGSRPIVFIRFNPDKYKDILDKTILSPFQYLKTGVPIIHLKKQWEERLSVLENAINISLKTVPEKEVSVVYLYYDGFDPSQQNVIFEDERCDE